MATQNRNPTSDISATGTWSGTAGTRYTLVDDYPTSTGDVLIHGTTAGNINFGFPVFNIPAIATAISVQVLYYDDRNGSASSNVGGRLRVGGAFYNAATHNPTNGVVVQRTDNFAVNPRTGVAWTVADINGTSANNLTGFGFISTDASPTVDIFSCQLQVTFTADYNFTAHVTPFNFTGIIANLLDNEKLIADTEAFALAGQDAGLAKGRTITADGANFALTGKIANLHFGHAVMADTRSYALSGQDASLRASRKIVGDSRTYTLTGIAAGLNLVRRLTANVGSILLSGVNAGLRTARKVTADVRAYAFTGQAALLEHNKAIPIVRVQFNLTGQDSGLRKTYRIAASVAAFTLSGVSANAEADRVVKADVGTFAFAGGDATLIRAGGQAFHINAEHVHFDIAGQSAGLRATRKMPVISRTFSLIGNDAQLPKTNAYRLIGASGVFNIAGQAALFKYSHVIAANKGTFVLTGTDSVLARGTKMPAQVASFALAGVNVEFEFSEKLITQKGIFLLTGNNVRFAYSGLPTIFIRVDLQSEALLACILTESEYKRLSLQTGFNTTISLPLSAGIRVGIQDKFTSAIQFI